MRKANKEFIESQIKPPKKHKIKLTDHGTHMLAAAVIERAVKDYRHALYKKMHGRGTNYDEGRIKECEKFFLSDWFYLMSGGTDGEKLIEKIKRDVTPMWR